MNRYVRIVAIVVAGIGSLLIVTWLLRQPQLAYANPATYYVRANATGDCRDAATPCGSIRQALTLATLPGDVVRVATGVYTENIGLFYGIQLEGGWDETFTNRDPVVYSTVVDGNGEHILTATVGIGAAQISGFTFRNGRDGLHIYLGTITVTENVVQDVRRQGVEIEAGRVFLANNTITNIAREGFEIDGGVVTLQANRILTTGRHAIFVEGGTVHIEDNTIRYVTGSDYHGIEVSGTQHVISGNLIAHIGDRGIHAHNGSATIVGNTISDTGGDGIRVGQTGQVTVRGNVVSATGNDGLDVRADMALIEGNRISNAGDRGINAEDGILTIRDNWIADTGGDGIRTSSSSQKVLIQGNTVQNADDDGVDARGDDITIIGNRIEQNGDNGVKGEESGVISMDANWVLSNTVGVTVRGAERFTLTNNVIGDQITASIELTGTGEGYLIHNTLVGRGFGTPHHVTALIVEDPLTVTLSNNIIASHTLGVQVHPSATLVVSNTLMWANGGGTLALSGTLSLFGPPMFVDPRHQDYHLRSASPAVDAGRDTWVAHDVDGEPRPVGVAPDIGADEIARHVFLPLVLHAYAAVLK